MFYLIDPINSISDNQRLLYDALFSGVQAEVYVSAESNKPYLKRFPKIDLAKKGLFSRPGKELKKQIESLIESISNEDVFISTSPIVATELASVLDQRIMLFLVDEIAFDKSVLKQLKRFPDKIKIVVPSNFAQEQLRSFDIDSRQITVIPLPYIEKNVPKTQSHQSYVLATISPLIANHGIETTIQALHEVQEFIPLLKVIIIGEGPEKRQLLWLIDHLNLRGKVQIIGNSEAYERFLPNVDVLVDANPQGVYFNPVLLEALGQGIPVIASNVGAHSELIEHNSHGLLFEPNNITMLSQHIINLYNHPEWVQHYKKLGQERVNELFSVERFRDSF